MATGPLLGKEKSPGKNQGFFSKGIVAIYLAPWGARTSII